MTYFQAIIIAIVEGLTEFLPVSSTGHMILTSAVMGIETDEFVKLFTVSIQLGAILAVVVLYFKRFFQSMSFYYKLFVAFIPSMIAGLLLKDYIDMLLESPMTVGVALVVGGVVLLFVDKWFGNEKVEKEITFQNAFTIGCFQVISMVPGVSRSAATTIGGMSQRLTRKQAAEFSFFLAVPTMFGATALGLKDDYHLITSENISLLLVGNVVAFIVAMIGIKTFIGLLTRYGFKWFGVYRIILGLIVIGALLSGVQLDML
ncbi:MAG TPA: undecaprenyl-diphosphate phosphatase [Chitinophagales bacterium]|nr:undecaprenyl-diphosphate phosphatase [Chitinophagales bacterium]